VVSAPRCAGGRVKRPAAASIRASTGFATSVPSPLTLRTLGKVSMWLRQARGQALIEGGAYCPRWRTSSSRMALFCGFSAEFRITQPWRLDRDASRGRSHYRKASQPYRRFRQSLRVVTPRGGNWNARIAGIGAGRAPTACSSARKEHRREFRFGLDACT